MDGFDFINVDLLRLSSVDCVKNEVVTFYDQFLVGNLEYICHCLILI